MRVFETLSSAAVLFGTAIAQWTTVRYYEESTGITYASFGNLPGGLTYRIALPAQSNTSDAIIQIVAPKAVGWAGFAWGGHMLNNPLSLFWETGSTTGPAGIVSSRMAFGYYAVPYPYDEATYTLLPKATTSNDTHWTVTARCQGCTRFTSEDGDMVIDSGDSAGFAFAYSSVAPLDRADNKSDFSAHENNGVWTHDLKIAKNSSYGTWIAENELGPVVVKREWYA